MNRTTAFALFVALLSCAPLAHATTIYKCTDAKGTVTMQNDKPCAPGQKQQIRTIGELPTAPAPVEKAVDVPVPTGPPPGARFELVRGPATEALPESQVAKDDRKPPPALFECKSWDNDTWLSETDSPQDRCAPLNTVGLNGGAGAGEACEIRRDTCTALADKALCTGWERRIEEAKFRMTFAPGAEKAERKAEYDRQLALYVDSTCR